MRIGIIARCDSVGLGIQSKEFFDNIPCKALVISIGAKKQNYEWFPNQKVVHITRTGLGIISQDIICDFISDIDVLVAFETPYDYNIFNLCRLSKVKTILQLNYEFLEYPSSFPKPDLFLAPSLWHYEDIPEPKMFLQVPVNTKYFKPNKKENTFVHIGGNKAIHDRNGTICFLKALQYVKSNITAIITSQHYLDMPKSLIIPKNVELITDFTNKENYYDNYSGGVLVLPRKYGGLCLPCQEGIACEMPVIMPDISPNNTWLPSEWLVPAKNITTFICKKPVEVFETNTLALADKIDEFCNESFYNEAIWKAQQIKETISYEKLLPEYYKLFEDVISVY